jgi:tetratricopeptide (TPR) repeat protein
MFKIVKNFFSRSKTLDAQIQAKIGVELDVTALKVQGNQSLARGDLSDAVACYERVASLTPQDSAAFVSLGYAQLESAQLNAATLSFERALALDARLVDAHFLLGLVLVRQNQPKQAVKSFKTALDLKPGFEPALLELARVHEVLNDLDAALQCYARALEANPACFDAALGKPKMLLGLERWQEALDTVLACSFADEHHILRVYEALALQRLKRHDEALDVVNKVVLQHANSVEALQVKAIILNALERYEAALLVYQQAMAINPLFVPAMSDAGSIYAKAGDFDQAVSLYSRAIAAQPDYADALHNYCAAFLHMGRCQEAIAMADKGLAYHPNHADMRWVKAAALLRSGEFEQGWKEYEWRWKAKLLGSNQPQPDYVQPMWTGQSVEGKTIWLQPEQGLGDTIQLLRYIPLLAAKGARVLLSVQEPIIPLCDALEKYCTLVLPGQAIPAFDYHCPLFSLPLAFKTDLGNIPSRVPYLAHEPDLQAMWEQRLGVRTAPRVGLVWSGNAAFQNDAKRSVPLDSLLDGLPKHLQLVSLQKEVRALDKPLLVASAIFDPGQDLQTFADTAALVACMDLVISVDTSVAHLTGALAKPLWLMLPYSPDWRWMMRRSDSPWYPTARLFRQEEDCRWQTVIAKIALEIDQFFNLKSLPLQNIANS